MPARITYGKRSKPIYNPISLSSPEKSLLEETRPGQVQCVPIRANESRKRNDPHKSQTRPPRKALDEKSHNEVVNPLAIVGHASKSESKSGRSGATDVNKGVEWKEASRVTRRNRPAKTTVVNNEDGSFLPSEQPAATDVRDPVVNPEAVQRAKHAANGGDTLQQAARCAKTSDDGIEPQDTTLGSHEVSQSHCKSLLQLSAHPLTCFNTWSSQLCEHFDVTKIAEASFAEVYRLSLRERVPDFSRTDESVFKIIPLKPAERTLSLDKRKRTAAVKRAELMSEPGDVANEVKLLQRMSTIPGFTNFRDIRILHGRPSEAFMNAYKAWNVEQRRKKKPVSEFPDPNKKSSYTDDQLWAVIEMQDAGTDLERFVENGECTSIWTVWDVFWQVVLSLAKGEESAEFEHRDLHLGNICVHSVRSPAEVAKFDPKRKLNFTSLETTIIDYTISRCLMPDTTTAYTDLTKDPALFFGDSTEEYQYDIYRYMRSALFFDDALADFSSRSSDILHDGRTWEQYHPQTNLVWLHLVLYKLMAQLIWPSGTKVPNKKTKREEYKWWKKANDLEHVLINLQDLLDPEQICANGIRSAGDLVLFALQEEWLDVEDVVVHGVGEESALVSQFESLEL